MEQTRAGDSGPVEETAAAARPWWERAPEADTAGPGGPAVSPPAGEEPGPRRRRWLAPAVLALVVLLAAAATITWLRWPPSTADAVVEAGVDVRTWEGVTHRARLTQPGAGPVDVELTSDGAGDVYGTLTRPGGGRAEYARVGGTVLLKGTSTWWQAEQDGGVKASRLSGYWVKPPASVTSWLAPAVPPTVTGLYGNLTGTGGVPPPYAEPGEREVDGESGRVVTWPGHEIVLSDGPDPRLLSVVPPGSADPAGVRVARPGPGAVAEVGRGADRVADAASYESLLYAPDAVQVLPVDGPECDTPRCPTPFTLVNRGDVEARGHAVLYVDGAEANRTSFRLAPGARQAFDLPRANLAYQRNQERVEFTSRIRIQALP